MANHGYVRNGLLVSLVFALALVFDSANAQWTTVGSVNSARSQVQQVYYNGYVYIFGGGGIPPGGSSYVAGMTAAQRISADSGKVTDLAPMPNGRRGGYAGLVNGKIYLVGGNSPSAVVTQVDIYDPATNSWTSGTPMPKGLLQISGATLGTNIYVMGGLTPSGTQYAYSQSTLVYDALTNAWTEINPAPYAPDLGCATAAGGSIFLTGGRTSSGTSALAYKGTPNGSLVTWTPLPNIPAAHYGSGAGAIGNDPYVAIGYDANATESRLVYKFDVAGNKWEASYSRPTASGLLNTLPGNGTSIWAVSGTGTTEIYKFTPGAAKPIANLLRDRLNLTVKQGEQKQGIVEIGNEGVAALSCTLAIPTDATWLQTLAKNFNVQAGGKYGINFNANAGSLAIGKYATDVTLTTNDADHASLTIRVVMWVVDASTPVKPTKLLVEVASGDWCPPCGAYGVPGIRALEAQYGHNLIVAENHDRGGRPTEYMHTDETEAINGWLGVPFFPASTFQRWSWKIDGDYMIGTGNWNATAQQVFSAEPEAPIALEFDTYSYDQATKKITGKVKLTSSQAIDLTGRSLRYTCYVTEDSVQLAQASAPETPFYHMSVVRDIYPDIKGGAIQIPSEALDDGGATLKPGYTIEVPISFTVNATYSYVPAKSDFIFLAHVNEGNGPGPVLAVDKIELTASITGGGGGGYTINIGEAFKSIEAKKDTAAFQSTITNNGTAPIEFSLSRVENNLPAGDWYSWYCLGNDCAAPSDNGPLGPATIQPGQTLNVTVRVSAGSAGTGTVKLRFTGPGGATQDQVYTVNASAGPGSVPGITLGSSSIQLGLNVPNPATETTRFEFSMPRAGAFTVDVFSITGTLVASLPARVVEAGLGSFDINVADLPNGVYTVRMTANGASAMRTMTVAR